MPYDNNTPQGNQTIAQTTDPIRNNFAFIQTDAQVEHQFNNGPNPGQAEGTHLKASMPNRVTPAVPSGCNGVYYVKSNQAWFTNGTLDVQLSLNNNLPGFTPFVGVITAASSGVTNLTPTISGNVCGHIALMRTTGNFGFYNFYQKSAGPNYTSVSTVSSSFGGGTAIIWNSGTLALNAASSGTYVYYGWFYPTA